MLSAPVVPPQLRLRGLRLAHATCFVAAVARAVSRSSATPVGPVAAVFPAPLFAAPAAPPTPLLCSCGFGGVACASGAASVAVAVRSHAAPPPAAAAPPTRSPLRSARSSCAARRCLAHPPPWLRAVRPRRGRHGIRAVSWRGAAGARPAVTAAPNQPRRVRRSVPLLQERVVFRRRRPHLSPPTAPCRPPSPLPRVPAGPVAASAAALVQPPARRAFLPPAPRCPCFLAPAQSSSPPRPASCPPAGSPADASVCLSLQLALGRRPRRPSGRRLLQRRRPCKMSV